MDILRAEKLTSQETSPGNLEARRKQLVKTPATQEPEKIDYTKVVGLSPDDYDQYKKVLDIEKAKVDDYVARYRQGDVGSDGELNIALQSANPDDVVSSIASSRAINKLPKPIIAKVEAAGYGLTVDEYARFNLLVEDKVKEQKAKLSQIKIDIPGVGQLPSDDDQVKSEEAWRSDAINELLGEGMWAMLNQPAPDSLVQKIKVARKQQKEENVKKLMEKYPEAWEEKFSGPIADQLGNQKVWYLPGGKMLLEGGGVVDIPGEGSFPGIGYYNSYRNNLMNKGMILPFNELPSDLQDKIREYERNLPDYPALYGLDPTSTYIPDLFKQTFGFDARVLQFLPEEQRNPYVVWRTAEGLNWAASRGNPGGDGSGGGGGASTLPGSNLSAAQLASLAGGAAAAAAAASAAGISSVQQYQLSHPGVLQAAIATGQLTQADADSLRGRPLQVKESDWIVLNKADQNMLAQNVIALQKAKNDPQFNANIGKYFNEATAIPTQEGVNRYGFAPNQPTFTHPIGQYSNQTATGIQTIQTKSGEVNVYRDPTDPLGRPVIIGERGAKESWDSFIAQNPQYKYEGDIVEKIAKGEIVLDGKSPAIDTDEQIMPKITPQQKVDLEQRIQGIEDRQMYGTAGDLSETDKVILSSVKDNTVDGVVDYGAVQAELQNRLAPDEIAPRQLSETEYMPGIKSTEPVEVSLKVREPAWLSTPVQADVIYPSMRLGSASEFGVPTTGEGWGFKGKGDVDYGGTIGIKQVDVEYYVGKNPDGSIGSLWWKEPGTKWFEGDYKYLPDQKAVTGITCRGRTCQLHEDDLKLGVEYILSGSVKETPVTPAPVEPTPEKKEEAKPTEPINKIVVPPVQKLPPPPDIKPEDKYKVPESPDQFAQWKKEADVLIQQGLLKAQGIFAGKDETGQFVFLPQDSYNKLDDSGKKEFDQKGITTIETWYGQNAAVEDAALKVLQPYKVTDGWDIAGFANDQRNKGASCQSIAQVIVNAGFERKQPGITAATIATIPPDNMASSAQYVAMNPIERQDYNKAHPDDPRAKRDNIYYDLAVRQDTVTNPWEKAGVAIMSFAEQFTSPVRVPSVIGKSAEDALLTIPLAPSWMKDIGSAAAVHEKPGALINNSIVLVPSDNKGNMGVILDNANNAILNWETKEQLQSQIKALSEKTPDWMHDIGKAGGAAQGATGNQDIAVNASAETLSQILGFAKMIPSVPIMVTKSYIDMTEDKKAEAITSMAALGMGVLMFPIQTTGQELEYIGKGDVGSAIGLPVGTALGLILTPALLKSKAKTLGNIARADTLSAQAHSVEIELPTAWQKGKLTPSAANELMELALKQVIAKYEELGTGKAKKMPSTIKVQNESGYLTVKITPEAQVAKLPISSHTTILRGLEDSLLKDAKVTIQSTAEILDPTAYYGVQPGSGIAITFGGAVPHQNLLPGMKPYTVSTALSPLEMMGVPMEVRNKLYWYSDPRPARLEMLRLWQEGKISKETFVGATKTWQAGTEAEVTQPVTKTLIKPPEEMIPDYMHREANGMPYTYVESPIDIRDINGDVVVHAGDRIKRYWVTTEEGAKWAVDNKLKLPTVWDNYKAELLGMTQLSLPRFRRWDIAGIEAESSPDILDRGQSLKTGEIKTNAFDDYVDAQGNIRIRSGEVYKPSKSEQPIKAGAKLGGIEETARSKVVVIPVDYSTGEIYLGKGGVAQPKFVVSDLGNPLDKYSKVNSFEEQARNALRDNTGLDITPDRLKYIGIYNGKVDVNALPGSRVYIADVSGITPPIKGTQAMKTWQPVNLSLLPKDYYDILMTEKSSTLPDTFAVGDMHGDRSGNRKLLEKEGIVRGGNYVKPDSETVWTGDYSDRGKDGIGLIKDVMKWEQQAPSVNSKVTALLGNHDPSLLAAADAMNETYNNLSVADKAYFNLNYSHKPYEGWNTASAQWLLQRADSSNKPILRTFLAIGGNLKEALEAGRDPAVMTWLRERPAMAKIGNDLYVHSDGTDFYKAYGNTIDEVNANIQNELQTKEGAYKIYHEMTGNRYWNAKNEDAQINDLLNTYGARRVIHGHTPIASDKPIVYANGKAVNINNIEYFSNATESQSILRAIQRSTPAEEAVYNTRLNELLSLAIDLTAVGDIDVSPAMYRIIEKVSKERPDLKIPMDKVHKYKGDAVYNVKSLIKTEDKGFATRIQPTLAEINAEGAARELTRERQIRSSLPPSIATKLPAYLLDSQTGALDIGRVGKIIDALRKQVETTKPEVSEQSVSGKMTKLERRFVDAGITDARNTIQRIQNGDAPVEELIDVAVKLQIPDKIFKEELKSLPLSKSDIQSAQLKKDIRLGTAKAKEVEKWIDSTFPNQKGRKPTPQEVKDYAKLFTEVVGEDIDINTAKLKQRYLNGQTGEPEITAWIKETYKRAEGKDITDREMPSYVDAFKSVVEEQARSFDAWSQELKRKERMGIASDAEITQWVNDTSVWMKGKEVKPSELSSYVKAYKDVANDFDSWTSDLRKRIKEGTATDAEIETWARKTYPAYHDGKALPEEQLPSIVDTYKEIVRNPENLSAEAKALRDIVDEAVRRNDQRKGIAYRPEFNRLARIPAGTGRATSRTARDERTARVETGRVVTPRPDDVRPSRPEPARTDRTTPSRGETPRPETVRPETYRAETVRAETVRVETPRPTPVPVRLPVPVPTTPPRLPPASTPIEKYRRLTTRQLQGAVSWKQGFVYVMWHAPWGQEDVIYSRKPLPDVKYFKGVGSAAASIVARQGEIPPHIRRDMGIVDISVFNGKSMSNVYLGDYNTKPLIKFTADPKQKTKYSGIVTTKEKL